MCDSPFVKYFREGAAPSSRGQKTLLPVPFDYILLLLLLMALIHFVFLILTSQQWPTIAAHNSWRFCYPAYFLSWEVQ